MVGGFQLINTKGSDKLGVGLEVIKDIRLVTIDRANGKGINVAGKYEYNFTYKKSFVGAGLSVQL